MRCPSRPQEAQPRDHAPFLSLKKASLGSATVVAEVGAEGVMIGGLGHGRRTGVGGTGRRLWLSWRASEMGGAAASGGVARCLGIIPDTRTDRLFNFMTSARGRWDRQ